MALAAAVVVLLPVVLYLLGTSKVREIAAPEPELGVAADERPKIAYSGAEERADVAPEPVPSEAAEPPPIVAPVEASDPAEKAVVGPGARTPGVVSFPPAAGPHESEELPVMPPEAPPLRLEGIAWSEAVAVAVINGRAMTEGEMVQGFWIVAIDRESVELRSGEEIITLRLRAKETLLRRAEGHALVGAALLSVDRGPVYDASYAVIDYPMGDPGLDRGAGVDLVVRAFRELGIDLQERIQEDIGRSRSAYGIDRQDPNLDHRRIRNQAVFLTRNALVLPSDREADWRAGDIVFWDLDGNGRPNHVGIVSDRTSEDGTPHVIHHLRPGRGFDGRPSEDDVLFRWPVTHHFRWPSSQPTFR